MAKAVRIRNLARPDTQPLQARWCVSFFCRLRGLTFRRSLPVGQGLLLVQPRDSRFDASIHMLFVFTDLTAVWINGARRVVDVQRARAWRPAYWPKSPARYVLEADPAHLNDFSIGDSLDFEEVSVA